MPSQSGASWLRYGGAFVAVILAVLVRLALDPVLGERFPFATLFFAVLIVAGYGGRGPALAATAFGALVSARFLLPPRNGFALRGIEEQAGMVLYLAMGLGIALLGGTLRTARRRAERQTDKALRRKDQLQATLVSIGDAVLVTDAEGIVTSLNPVAESLTGWSQAEAAGQHLASIFHIVNEHTRQGVENPAFRALKEGTIVGLANHTILLGRDGIERPIEDSAAPIRDETGTVIGAVLVFRDVSEKRRSGRALETSEARKAAILDTALDAIVSMDHEGKVIDWNRAAERLFGRDRAAVLGRDMGELIVPPSLREAHRRGLARYLQTGEGRVLGRRIEITAMRADGSEFPVELAIIPISTEGPPEFTAHIRDITVGKAAERRRNARLAVTEVFAGAETPEEAAAGVLRAVCQGLGWDVGAIWTTEEGGGVLRCLDFWSRPSVDVEAFEADSRTRRYPRGIGLPGRVWETGRTAWIADVTIESNFPRATLAVEAGLHGAFGAPITAGEDFLGVAEFYSGEVREPDPDLLEMMATLGGQIGQFLERRRAEERLRRSERELADFFENATIGLHWVGPDGTVLRANRAELDMLGYDRDEYVGRHIAEFHVDDDAICDILRRLQVGEALQDYPARLRCKDGRIKEVLIDSSVMREDGEFVHTRCFTRDVTERKQAEEELRAAKEEAEAANRAKSQFLAVLSHELRTPLNPILLAATSMLERPADPEEIRPTLEMIRQNVNLQARLIDDLLDVMRIVRGKMPLHWEVADGHALIRQALQMCQSEILGKDLRLDLGLGAQKFHLNADPARFQQVIWNLIKNAVKFTPEGGVITVRTRNVEDRGGGEDRLVIEISDTGIGIEPEVLPLIFDPFQQGETRITRKFGGLGLGLAICRGIVDAHGGTLKAESPGAGQGATFGVELETIPNPAPTAGEPASLSTAGASAPPQPLRILVVEDEPATLRLMARLLGGLGHSVATANSIAAGCEAYLAGEFDLIISDIGLPDGSGLELMRRIVASRGRIAAIALTGYGMEEDIQKSREAGFTAHMTKPIDFTKLESIIGQVAPGEKKGVRSRSNA
jgi:PAS domain S-box-containing protein